MYFDPKFAQIPKAHPERTSGVEGRLATPVTREEGGKEGSLNLGYD